MSRPATAELPSMLITGASGLLGASLAIAAAERYRVVAIVNRHRFGHPGVMSEAIDLRTRGAVASCLDHHRPDVVVHLAAQTNVDRCEERPQEAYDLNVALTREICDWVKGEDATLVFMSTDSVFDGIAGDYTEESPTKALTCYAATKLEAEAVVRRHVERHLIIRGCFYGWGPQQKQSLGEWILGRLRDNLAVPAYEDAIFTPLLNNSLAAVILNLCATDATGTFHVGSADRMSKYAFARLVAERFGMPADLVRPTVLANAGRSARRPLNTSLKVEKVSRQLGIAMPTIESDIDQFWHLAEQGYPAFLKGLAGCN
jgi:dTDP-4-dehydrorhamnose reductase